MSSITDHGPFLCIEEAVRLFKISRTKAYKEAQQYIETAGKAGIPAVRDRPGIEVDIVVERPDGRVMAIEVKSSRSVNQRDASGLTFLRERLGERFECGILFHTGPITARFSDRVWAVPVAALWGGVSGAKDALEGGRS